MDGVRELASHTHEPKYQPAEQVARFKDTIKAKLNMQMAANLEACVHCGQCAQACHFYHSTRNPKYTPIRKLDLLKRIYRRELSPLRGLYKLWTKDVTRAEMDEWVELVYDSCTECGRCSMICPMGINIAAMVNVNRQAFARADMIPGELAAMEREQYAGNTLFGMGLNEVRGAIEGLSQQHGVDIPLNKDKADVLLLTSVVETVIMQDQLVGGAKVLNHLGLDWTIHLDGFEAANFGLLSGFEPLQKYAGDKIVQTAKRLGVKKVVVPECGHAYPSLRWEQPNEDGETFPFEVLTMSEFLGQEVMAGRLKLKKIGKSQKVTFHDPCKVGRHSGVFDEPRAVLHALDLDFREVSSSREMNWCCGGGAGVFLLSSAENLRHGAWNIKQKQIDRTGADEVILSCASCRFNFIRGADKNDWKKPITSLVDLVSQNLE